MKPLVISVCLLTLAVVEGATGRPASSAGEFADTVIVPFQSEELPSGPNFALYKASCLTCHTSGFVIQAPKSPRTYWETEVKKMVDLYDAPINDGNQKLIVDYLMSVRGLPAAGSK